ncbi:hypothetical protein LCGC14_2231300 [marine sediment metagenome]|uniref:Uncharacterized protein n=1 Tax=marine sediment metagenome TaxID=412755 RepID=A0A0F9FKS1_9ZZZZ
MSGTMTIEERREDMFKAVRDFCVVLRAEGVIHKPRFSASGDADELLSIVSEKGAVLKVEREMPIPKDWIGDFNPGIFTEQVLIAAGFTATAPLIEPEKPSGSG